MSLSKTSLYSDYEKDSLRSFVPYQASKRSDTSAALSGYGHSGYGHSGYGDSYKEECCPLVIDTLCLIAIIASTLAASAFLNRVIQRTDLINGRKKRDTPSIVMSGKRWFNCLPFDQEVFLTPPTSAKVKLQNEAKQ